MVAFAEAVNAHRPGALLGVNPCMSCETGRMSRVREPGTATISQLPEGVPFRHAMASFREAT